GKENAIRSYLSCRQSIYDLADVIKELTADVAFSLRQSFQFASRRSHIKRIELEYQARKAIGIEIDLLNEREVKKLFHFAKPAGLLSKDGGQVDAYRLTHALLEQVERK